MRNHSPRNNDVSEYSNGNPGPNDSNPETVSVRPPGEHAKWEMESLKKKTISELMDIAHELNLEGLSGLRKQELIYKILESATKLEKEEGEAYLSQDTSHRRPA